VQLFSQYGQVLKIVTFTKNGRPELFCHSLYYILGCYTLYQLIAFCAVLTPKYQKYFAEVQHKNQRQYQ